MSLLLIFLQTKGSFLFSSMLKGKTDKRHDTLSKYNVTGSIPVNAFDYRRSRFHFHRLPNTSSSGQTDETALFRQRFVVAPQGLLLKGHALDKFFIPLDGEGFCRIALFSSPGGCLYGHGLQALARLVPRRCQNHRLMQPFFCAQPLAKLQAAPIQLARLLHQQKYSYIQNRHERLHRHAFFHQGNRFIAIEAFPDFCLLSHHKKVILY
jgi:hypothetical protein